MLRKIIFLYRDAYAGLPRNAWLLSLVQFVNRSGSMVLFFLSLYLTRKMGFSLAQAGQAVSAFGCGSLAGAYLGGILCDRLGATAVQRLSLLLSGVNLIVMGYLGTFPLIVAAAFLQGVFAEALLPGNTTAMARECPPRGPHQGFRPEPPGRQPGSDHRPGARRLPGHVELPRPVLGGRPDQPGRPGAVQPLFQERAAEPGRGGGAPPPPAARAGGATCGPSFSWFSGSA